MTLYSPVAILRIWLRNGGNTNSQTLVAACAVALAESGGQSTAIGPAGDYGLWQINRVNFAHFGVNSTTVLNPDTNARIAIAMSSNGYNWAAWCTAWADPGPNCGHGLLRFPQPHSSAWYRFDAAEAAASVISPEHGPVPRPQRSPAIRSVAGAWADTQHYQNHGAPKQFADLANLRTALRKV